MSARQLLLHALAVPHYASLTAAGRLVFFADPESPETVREWMRGLTESEWEEYVELPPNDGDANIEPGEVLYGWTPEDIVGQELLEIFRNHFLFLVAVGQVPTTVHGAALVELNAPDREDWVTAARSLREFCPCLPDYPSCLTLLYTPPLPV